MVPAAEHPAGARRGHYTIFLGMAAGVGKTYRMLLEGHALQEAGRDVVIGDGVWLASHVLVLGPVTIGEHADLLRDCVDIDDAVWAAGAAPIGRVSGQWRAHGAAVPAHVDGRRVVFD